MSHRVLELPSAKRAELEKLLAADPLSRQSITTKDARAFDLDRSAVIVILEGDESVLAQAQRDMEALGGRVPPEAERVFAAYRDESDAAAGGMGFVFG